MLVTLSYPNGSTQEVLLADIPRKTECIRLRNGPDQPLLLVESVIWLEGRDDRSPDPTVLLKVRKQDDT